MDIKSKDILKQALKAYDGTLLVVSHDRDFLDGLVDKMYEFRDGKVREHLGSVTEFLQKRKMETLQELEATFRNTSLPIEERKTALEKMKDLELKLAQDRLLIAQQAEDAAYDDFRRITALDREVAESFISNYLEKKRDLDARTAEWEKLMEETL